MLFQFLKGETFSEQESGQLFFSVTKLFSSTEINLRRMIYLMIKEYKNENCVYIVTSSLVKDISSKKDLFRMCALRTIPIVLDSSNLV